MDMHQFKQPVQCHLWQKETLQSEDLDGIFETIQVLVEESHDIRKILRCTKCGQEYFYEFHEEIDWAKGNDPQYRTYIPVFSKEDIDVLTQSNFMSILNFSPRLQIDWPSNGEKSVAWIGRENLKHSEIVPDSQL